MKKNNFLINHIVEILQNIFTVSTPTDLYIANYFKSRKYLGSKDRRIISDIIFGIIRNRTRVETIADEIKNDFLEFDFLHLCILIYIKIFENNFEIENPLLNKIDIEKIENKIYKSKDFEEQLAFKYSFPIWFLKKNKPIFSDDELEKVLISLNKKAQITIRINTLKCSLEKCMKELLKENLKSSRTNFSPFGLNLEKRFSNTLKIFQSGFFEIQDEGSQLVSLLMDAKVNETIIDACCGSGGKSLAMSMMMKNNGKIFAFDVSKGKINELKKRIKKSNAKFIFPSTYDEIDIEKFHAIADKILIDVPCSGSGTIRRNPMIKWKLTENLIKDFSLKQKEILSLYSRFVKKNGILIYATCSMFKEENEDIISYFLQENKNFEIQELPIFFQEKFNSKYFFKTFSHKHSTDIFFASILKRIN